MTLSSKVNDTINLLILHQLVESIEITDIHLHELVVRLILNVLEVSQVTCVCQFIKTDNAVVRVFAQHVEHKITADEAAQMMQEETGFVLLDVRTQEEYASGHIPGAICIPNETIGSEEIPELPDKDQLILVYCRSGNRSKQASQKLAEQGYTNVVEFGGINGWTGEIVQ